MTFSGHLGKLSVAVESVPFSKPKNFFLSCRHFRTSSDDDKGRLKFYISYACFYFSFIIVLFIFEALSFTFHRNYVILVLQFYLLSFIVIGLLDVLFLIMTAIKIFHMSKTSISSENSRFVVEKDR